MDIYKSEYNQKLVVSRAIERERKYQDHKWGTIEESPHSIERWIEIIQGELDEAKEALWEKIDTRINNNPGHAPIEEKNYCGFGFQAPVTEECIEKMLQVIAPDDVADE